MKKKKNNSVKADVSSCLKHTFRRGKKFQEAYFDIGNTNCMIGNLKIEADCYKRHRKPKEAKWRLEQIDKLKAYLREKYDPEIFDLEFTLPQISGLYVKRSRKCVL